MENLVAEDVARLPMAAIRYEKTDPAEAGERRGR